jgi:hypothetical protein
VTGETVNCLNLSSYNYLGFGCTDPYCTPRVQNTLQEFGTSMCSTRIEGGEPSTLAWQRPMLPNGSASCYPLAVYKHVTASVCQHATDLVGQRASTRAP